MELIFIKEKNNPVSCYEIVLTCLVYDTETYVNSRIFIKELDERAIQFFLEALHQFNKYGYKILDEKLEDVVKKHFNNNNEISFQFSKNGRGFDSIDPISILYKIVPMDGISYAKPAYICFNHYNETGQKYKIFLKNNENEEPKYYFYFVL